jgi:hypothetical protein
MADLEAVLAEPGSPPPGLEREDSFPGLASELDDSDDSPPSLISAASSDGELKAGAAARLPLAAVV